MRSIGSASELERRRRLAVRRHASGDSIADIAEFLEVTPRSVQRWVAARRRGVQALRAVPAPGRPPKLDHMRIKIVHRWLAQNPMEFGFATELWTAKRLTTLIRQAWRVSFNPRALCRWLHHHGYSPQKPQRVPRERDVEAIRGWCRTEWPRLQKKRDAIAATLFSWTKAVC
jgi:transposase